MWKTVKLGDVCEFENGDRGKNYPSKKHQISEGIPFINAGDLTNEGEISSDGMAYISDERFNLLGAGKVRINDVLFCLRGSLGKCAINKAYSRGAIASSLVILRPDQNAIIPEYLLYLLKSVITKDLIVSTSGGAAQPNLSAKTVANYKYSLPPLAEQQRIVEKLDRAFEEIDRAIEATEKAINQASLVTSSSIERIFSRESKEWRATTIGEACVIERGSSPRPIQSFFTNDNGVNWVKIGDTEQNGKYVNSTRQKITVEGAKKSRFVKKGDLILTNSMSFGRPYIMNIDGYIHDGWFVLRLGSELDSEYMFYLLGSPYVQRQFNSLAAGSVVKNISSDLTKRAKIPIPPIARQREVAEEISLLEEKLSTYSEIEKEKLGNLFFLKSAILAQELKGPEL